MARRQAPLYQEIADRLRDDIKSLASGSRIPSEPELAKHWGVSRFTAARAVEELVGDGLITRRQGSGSYVAEAPLRRSPGYLLSFTEAVEAAGHRAAHRLLAFEPVERRDERLPYATGTPLVLLDRLRLVDGKAIARHRSFLSGALVEETGLTSDKVSRPDFSLYRFFAEHGLSVHSATEHFMARPATAEDRQLLKLGEGGVVVAVRRNSFASDGTAIDAVDAIYDARRYSYEARLVRQHFSGNTTQDTENSHETIIDGGEHIGPRLGPWGGER